MAIFLKRGIDFKRLEQDTEVPRHVSGRYTDTCFSDVMFFTSFFNILLFVRFRAAI